MKKIILVLFVGLLVPASHGAEEPESIPNRLVDYPGFRKIVNEAAKERRERRITEEAFFKMSRLEGVVVLDARSQANFKRRHIQGAVNLPFTEFTAETLAGVIPAKKTPILIYCNNNFLGSPVAFASKKAEASLNLSTWTSLKAYGYENIFELGPLLAVDKTILPFAGTELDQAPHAGDSAAKDEG